MLVNFMLRTPMENSGHTIIFSDMLFKKTLNKTC